jgi:hypothetical protein
MLAAALLASLWAQAEQAPTPAPAPASPPKPFVAKPAPTVPPNGVSVHARFAYRVGEEGKHLGPAAGFSLGGMFERRYLGTRGGVELGAGVDFFHDQFSASVVGSAPDATGVETEFPGNRTLSRTSFSLLQILAWRAADLRLFIGVGGGVTIGYFSSPELELRPGSASAAQPLARGVVGAEFGLSPLMAVIVRVDYSHAFTRPIFTTNAATTHSLFGDILDAGAGLLVRF